MKLGIQAFVLYVFMLSFSGMTTADISRVSISVTENPVVLDSAVELIVTADGAPNQRNLDLSQLETQFKVGPVSVSTSTRISNNATQQNTTWSIRLMPYSTGTFSIGPLYVDGVMSNELDLEVVAPNSRQAQQTRRDFFVEAELSTQDAYLQQQLLYTTRIFLGRDIRNPSLTPPQLDNAIIRQVGQDNEYTDLIKGVQYRVIERKFAIIPQQSGPSVIKGAVFEGEVLNNTRSTFGFYRASQSLVRRAADIGLNVRQIPANYAHHWLPSTFVELRDELPDELAELRVGDPITRTIILTVSGVVEEQLPELTFEYPSFITEYPEQASTATVEQGGTLVAQKTQSAALIISQSGVVELPEVRIPWFNVATEQTEYAVLPARKLMILPADSGTSPINPLQSTSVSQDAGAGGQQTGYPIANRFDYLHVALTALILLSTTLSMWLYRKQRNHPSAHNAVGDRHSVTQNASEQQQWKALTKALRKQDFANSRAYLEAWIAALQRAALSHSGGNEESVIIGIVPWSNTQSRGLQQQINSLLSQCYGNTASPLDVEKLISELTHARDNTLADQSPSDLPSLYPQG